MMTLLPIALNAQQGSHRPPPNAPGPEPALTPGEALEARIARYEEERVGLSRALQEALVRARLKEADAVDRESVIAQFNAAHADRIARLASDAQAIHEALNTLRRSELAAPPRQDAATEFTALKDELNEAKAEYRSAQMNLREELKNATLLQRDQLIHEFRDTNRGRLDALKDLRRSLRRRSTSDIGADRRLGG